MESAISPSDQDDRPLAAIAITESEGFKARLTDNRKQALLLIQRDFRLMRRLCQHYEGEVIKVRGYGLLMYFPSAVRAVSCTLDIQKTLATLTANLSANDSLTHRIGIHFGEAIVHNAEVTGDSVDIAACLQTKAEAGGICISQTVYDRVNRRLSLHATYVGDLRLATTSDPVPAYRIVPATPSNRAEPASVESASADEIIFGSLIDNRYRIQKVLGRGGFGRTYLAADTQRFNHLCVLKEFAPASRTEYTVQKARELFEREARVLYELDHPQIPKFLAWFTYNEKLFLVQEYIHGKTYAALLRERQRQGWAFSEAEVTQWLSDLLSILSYLHHRNIVHRDISPDNVMRPEGQISPMLIDFGLVKQSLSQIQLDTDGGFADKASFVGKFGYAPPEQIRMGQCYPSSDLYALAVTAVVLLTGQEPGLLMHRDSLEWHWRSYVTVSDRLAQILDRMLQERPRDRFQSAEEALQALHTDSGASGQTDTVPLSRPNLTPQPPPQPRPAPVPLPTSAPYAALSHDFLDRCKQELASRIGPIASFILESTLAQHPHANPAQLVEALALEIPEPQQAEAFRHSLEPELEFLTQTTQPDLIWSTSTESLSDSMEDATLPPPIDSDDPVSIALTPEFLEHCRQALARCIGPMASLILDDVLAQNPRLDPPGLIEAIVAEIPDPQQAKAFQRYIL
jgi:serine/threonine protein kinase/class 3 adenylate cyclase